MEILRILGVAAAISAFIIWRGARSEYWDAPTVTGTLVGAVFFIAGMVMLETGSLAGIAGVAQGVLGIFMVLVCPWLLGRAAMLWLEDGQKKRSASGR